MRTRPEKRSSARLRSHVPFGPSGQRHSIYQLASASTRWPSLGSRGPAWFRARRISNRLSPLMS